MCNPTVLHLPQLHSLSPSPLNYSYPLPMLYYFAFPILYSCSFGGKSHPLPHPIPLFLPYCQIPTVAPYHFLFICSLPPALLLLNFLICRKWMVTAIGLGVIPFIVHPIDKYCIHVFSSSLILYFQWCPCGDGQHHQEDYWRSSQEGGVAAPAPPAR